MTLLHHVPVRECKSSILGKTVYWLCYVYSGNPWKGGLLILRQIPIYWFSFFCSNDSACNSYRRAHLPCHIGHAGFVQQRIQWWPGRWFIQCSPPVGGVVCLSLGSGKHLGRFSFLYIINTLRPRQNGLHFPDDIFKCIYLNENAWIAIKISLKFVPPVPINNIPAMVQIFGLIGTCQATSHYLNQWCFFLTEAHMHHSASMS